MTRGRKRIYPGTYEERILAVLDTTQLLPQQMTYRLARMAPATALATLAGLVEQGRVELFLSRSKSSNGTAARLYRRVA